MINRLIQIANKNVEKIKIKTFEKFKSKINQISNSIELSKEIETLKEYLSEGMDKKFKNTKEISSKRYMKYNNVKENIQRLSNHNQHYLSQSDRKLQDFSNNSFQKSAMEQDYESTIFDKLHEEHNSRIETQKLNQELKTKKELENCTFRPTISSKSRSNSNICVYDRLSRTAKNEKELLYKAEKEAIESKNCSFKPEVTRAKRNSNNNDSVHERLYKEAEEKEKARKYKEVLLKDKNLSECTFKPSIDSKRNSTSVLEETRFEKLHNDGEKKRSILAEKEILHEQESLKYCTFKPQTNSQILSSEPAHERLYRKRLEKNKIIEKKRKELEEEERKMMGCNKKAKLDPFKSVQAIISESSSRLYNSSEEYEKRKSILKQQIMLEEGCIFNPKINKNSDKLAERAYPNSKIIERNETFIKKKEENLIERENECKNECTFMPRLIPGKIEHKVDNKNVSERLYEFMDTYEKKKEELRMKYGQ